MDPRLVLKKAPQLDPAWLEYEQKFEFLVKKAPTDVTSQKRSYAQGCRDLNAELLADRDSHLNHLLTTTDFHITHPEGGHDIQIRKYTPNPQSQLSSEDRPAIIYFHGGGLYVGDLDSEDLSCRRICKGLKRTVYSCNYRLMPEFTADDALSDALRAFEYVSETATGPLVLVGSSSGGQLAAQVSQAFVEKCESDKLSSKRLAGVLLRGPVTCDASEQGVHLPAFYRQYHTSLTPDFHTSILSGSCIDAEHRTSTKLPLEMKNFKGLPAHWIQVCTNDIFYSDGICYAEGLRLAGIEVKLDVIVGWPHTFWLKAPYSERARKADSDMIQGLKWLSGIGGEMEYYQNC